MINYYLEGCVPNDTTRASPIADLKLHPTDNHLSQDMQKISAWLGILKASSAHLLTMNFCDSNCAVVEQGWYYNWGKKLIIRLTFTCPSKTTINPWRLPLQLREPPTLSPFARRS
ncbi:hypothetical protein O181_024022 [Austropuccinia psidii MF-1]|uniref:Uncharacterized protein n=1 Tax=Austropuccinia psidii MF-1 TaxID=1389203 RepID=A0A9Q3CKN7_9BASI|nr:hypothetical protein [Austropuccinia psidii MF-1]